MWLYHRIIRPKGADGMANSVDPDMVWSGCKLFAQTCLSENFITVFQQGSKCQSLGTIVFLSAPHTHERFLLLWSKRPCFAEWLIGMVFCFQGHTTTFAPTYQITMYHNFQWSEISRCMTKQTKWPVLPAKTPISLGICPVWSESSPSLIRGCPHEETLCP